MFEDIYDALEQLQQKIRRIELEMPLDSEIMSMARHIYENTTDRKTKLRARKIIMFFNKHQRVENADRRYLQAAFKGIVSESES